MDGKRLQRDGPKIKHFVLSRALAEHLLRFAGEERSDAALFVRDHFRDRSLCDDRAAVRSGFRSHLDDPVGYAEDLGVVIHQDHRVPVLHQIIHDRDETVDIGGVQPDGRLVQDVQDSRGAVADRTCKLHPLPLSCGERGGCAVQGKVSQAEIQQSPRCDHEGFTDGLRHGTHLLRKIDRDIRHPFHEIGKGHGAHFIQGLPHQPRGPRRFGQPRSPAFRTHIHFQELLNPLHALLILHLGQGILHGMDRAVVGEIHFREDIGVLRFIQDMFLLRGSVENDILFSLGELVVRDVGPYPHLTADVGHEGPHKAVPRGYRSIIDGLCLIRHQGGFIHHLYGPGTSASPAGSLAVEGELLRGGRHNASSAHRTDDLLLRRHIQCRFQIVAVWAAVTGKP